MKPFTLTAALAAAVGLAGSAAAGDCSGCYDVDGRYSNGVRTDAEIEEFAVFCACVAGKTANIVRRQLHEFWQSRERR